MTARRAAATERIPLVLRLLDHQLVGSDDELLGNVDDLVLEPRGGDLWVTGLLSGPPALARRQGGRGEVWVDAVWRRLHPLEHPQLVGVPLASVTRLGSDIRLDAPASALLGRNLGLERWVREKVVSRLPWATGGGDEDEERRRASAGHGVGFLVPLDAPTVSRLVGARLRTTAGEDVGEVIEVVAEGVRDGRPAGPMRVVALVVSRRRLGTELGYTLTPQGPALLRHLLRWWHRDDRHVRAEDLTGLDWGTRTLTVRDGAELRHPHDVDA